MVFKVLIALLGAGIFLRIVGKEKNRRYRHLLRRIADLQAEQEAERQANLPAVIILDSEEVSETETDPDTDPAVSQAA